MLMNFEKEIRNLKNLRIFKKFRHLKKLGN